MEHALNENGGDGETVKPRTASPLYTLGDADLACLLLDWDEEDVELLAETETAATDEMPPERGLNSFSTTVVADTRSDSMLDHALTTVGSTLGQSDTRPVGRSSLCRQRQRQELQQLRLLVGQLEDELKQCTRAGTVTAAQSSAWQSVVQCERQRKREAQIENEKLRRLLSHQRKIASRLETALLAGQRLRRTCEEELRTSFVDLQPESLSSGAAAVMDAIHRDALIEQNQDYEQIKLTKDSRGRMSLENAFCRVFPSDFAKSSARFWEIYCSDHFLQACGEYASLSSASGTFVASLEIPIHVGGQTVVTQSRFLLRRVYQSPHRVVIRWEDATGDDSSDGRVRIQMDAYLCVESQQSDLGPVTVARAYSIFKPITTSSSIINDPIRVASGKLVEVAQVGNEVFFQRLHTFFMG